MKITLFKYYPIIFIQVKNIHYSAMEPQAQKMNKSSQNQLIQFEAIINNNATKVQIDQKTLKADKIQINIYDMIGLIQSEVKKKELSYFIYYYPKRKKLFKNTQRYLQKMEFEVKELTDWQQIRLKIISRIYNRPIQASLKLLIFYNPVSGSNSQKHLNNILSFIKCTNIQPEVVRTNHRNHCIEYLKNHQKNGEDGKKEYCGVAIVSGDGLMHQYVNSFCQIPVTHVPAGSGNAFAKTQMHYAGELCKDEESIFLVIKNNTRKFHLVKYELEQRTQPIYSFLSLQWAMIADLDVNSEFLRCLGGLRFQIYAAWLILRHKRYLGKLSYSTIQYQIPPFNIQLYSNPNYHVISTFFSHTIFCLIPFISEKHKIAPLIRQDQHYIDMQAIQYEAGRYQLLKYLLSSESGSHFDLKEERPSPGYKFMHRKVRSFRLEPMDENQMGVFCIDGQMYEAQRLQASLSDKFFRAFV